MKTRSNLGFCDGKLCDLTIIAEFSPGQGGENQFEKLSSTLRRIYGAATVDKTDAAESCEGRRGKRRRLLTVTSAPFVREFDCILCRRNSSRRPRIRIMIWDFSTNLLEQNFTMRTETFDATKRYIDDFYNPRRRHLTLGYLRLINYEEGGELKAEA